LIYLVFVCLLDLEEQLVFVCLLDLEEQHELLDEKDRLDLSALSKEMIFKRF
jgi:hypothetical protein